MGMAPAQADATGEVTRLLRACRAGDRGALDSLFDLVYQELKAIAAHRLARLHVHGIDPTELVNEAVLRLLVHTLDANDRQHFFKIAATAIRYTLIDIARRQHSEKHGGNAFMVTLSKAERASAANAQWLEVESALDELERLDPRKCRVVELAYLVGLNRQEIADTLAISLTTVERELRFAKVWLHRHLSP